MRHIHFFILIALCTLSGCYDGWEPDSGGSNLPPFPTPGEKKIFHIQFVTVTLDPTAVNDPTCFGATGTENFRIAEWTERITAISDQLVNLAETYALDNIFLRTSDCTQLQALIDKAIDSSYLDNLIEDDKDRPIVHLTAAFWDGDVAGASAPQVTKSHWASPQKLVDRGRNVSSLNYFSISNPIIGKFSNWRTIRSSKDPNLVLSGTPINQVDPTSSGSDNRKSIALKDAQDVAAWITRVATSN